MGKIREGSIGTHSDNKDPDGLDAHEPGAKLDAGKPRMTLVLQNFRRALALVGQVGTYGANKYSDNGWVFVNNGVERYSDALFRHLLEEEYALQPDPESKIPHAAHAAWNALARLELMLRQELEADSEVWEAPHNVKKLREMNEQPKMHEMHEDTLLATTKRQRAAKALRNIVNAIGVVLDDEHEAMLSNCEADTAKRMERLRLRKLFAPMKPALMERIQLGGEGLPESMKGRRFTEEELSDLAELRINEMVSDQMKEKKELIRLIREGWSIPDDMKGRGRSLTEEEIDGIAEREMQYRRILLDFQLAERLRQRKEKEAAGFVGQQQEWFNEDDEDYDDY